ncbi:hypothetical protein BB042_02485 [Neisseria gonorrhoeae]|nr:hypothetical protein BB003_00950 [Neisseria gonorrhoeae]OHZ70745.1 hypothetical protein BBZ81_10975 [Neisseria gonorrhoeae]OHZ90416.1 hypothetical protein BBZ90_04930 [Neisseria gonorrhoeae]OIA26473.1 hypothetical protein BBZ93_05450 [Neisseria gonorrhoeae]OIA38891.1 hypothetical protein BBZ88_02340 [Neisseria gonorrhoeae]
MPSFPRRRESRTWDNSNIQRLSESPGFWIPTFVGMTGCRFAGMTRCRFLYGWIRHSRAGGNPDRSGICGGLLKKRFTVISAQS